PPSSTVATGREIDAGGRAHALAQPPPLFLCSPVRTGAHHRTGRIMESYDEAVFKARVDAALRRIRTILDNTPNPQYPADVPHRYDDKYPLAELLTRVSVASVLQCLGNIGLSSDGLTQLREWVKTRSVTIRLRAQEDCKFLREQQRKVESAEQKVTE